MRRSVRFVRRRALLLGVPTVLAGAAVYVPNAMAMNGGTFLGAALLVGTAVAVSVDQARAVEGEQ